MSSENKVLRTLNVRASKIDYIDINFCVDLNLMCQGNVAMLKSSISEHLNTLNQLLKILKRFRFFCRLLKVAILKVATFKMSTL